MANDVRGLFKGHESMSGATRRDEDSGLNPGLVMSYVEIGRGRSLHMRSQVEEVSCSTASLRADEMGMRRDGEREAIRRDEIGIGTPKP